MTCAMTFIRLLDRSNLQKLTTLPLGSLLKIISSVKAQLLSHRFAIFPTSMALYCNCCSSSSSNSIKSLRMSCAFSTSFGDDFYIAKLLAY